jgi:HAD superfamily hydrolase (TIGR01490 family)
VNLAIFDLDNTLLAGDSDYQWGEFLIEIGVLDRAQHQAVNDRFYADYKAGNLDIMAFLAFQLRPLHEHPRQQLEAWHARFMQEKIRPMMTQKSQALVQSHRDRGDALLIITATNSFVTKPIATAFGIDDLIGTDPEQVDGEFTGQVAGLPSFKEGKVTRLYAWLQARGKRLEDFDKVYFYSDSHNDLPLLNLVNTPVAVNPDAILQAQAEKLGWPIISLRD